MKALRKLLFFLSVLMAVASVNPAAYAGPVLVPSVSTTVGLTTALRAGRSTGDYGLFSQCLPNSAFGNMSGNYCDNIKLWHRMPSTAYVTGIQLWEGNYDCAPAENNGPNIVVYRAAIEYPAGTYWPLYWHGQRDMVLAPGGQDHFDPLPITIQGGCWTRRCVAVASPPTSFSAVGSGSGGTLAAATYFYKITTMTQQAGESGPATEVSYVATGSTSSVALSWAFSQTLSPPLRAQYYNIYRSTSTGAEVFLTSVPAGTTSWTDTGAIAPGSGTPPAAGQWPISGIVGTNNGNSTQGDVASTAYQDYTTGAGSITSSNVFVCGPVLMTGRLPNGQIIPSVAIFGDSRATGTGSTGPTAAYGYITDAFLTAGDAGNLFSWVKVSVGSDSAGTFITNANHVHRGQLLDGVSTAICEMGINDTGGTSVATIAGNLIGIWQYSLDLGLKYVYQTTMEPKVGAGTSVGYTIPSLEAANSSQPFYDRDTGTATSSTTTVLTDTSKSWTASRWAPAGLGFTLAIISGTGQSQFRPITASSSNTITVSPAFSPAPAAGSVYIVENDRDILNEWIRNGAYVTGTARNYAMSWSTCTGAFKCPLLAGYEETSLLIEGGTPTGRWYPHVYHTGTVASATSTTATLDTGFTGTNNQYAGYNIVITAGTGANTSTTITASSTANPMVITVASWGTQPDNTSQFQIVKARTSDGTHPGTVGADDLAAGITLTHYTAP